MEPGSAAETSAQRRPTWQFDVGLEHETKLLPLSWVTLKIAMLVLASTRGIKEKNPKSNLVEDLTPGVNGSLRSGLGTLTSYHRGPSPDRSFIPSSDRQSTKRPIAERGIPSDLPAKFPKRHNAEWQQPGHTMTAHQTSGVQTQSTPLKTTTTAQWKMTGGRGEGRKAQAAGVDPWTRNRGKMREVYARYRLEKAYAYLRHKKGELRRSVRGLNRVIARLDAEINGEPQTHNLYQLLWSFESGRRDPPVPDADPRTHPVLYCIPRGINQGQCGWEEPLRQRPELWTFPDLILRSDRRFPY
ncbi:hypothetical protein Bbelb_319140 [Branchiostoma belcheri]|nr:hypothetical protein Bbelb_319140 [Branchiostoma belcheri]